MTRILLRLALLISLIALPPSWAATAAAQAAAVAPVAGSGQAQGTGQRELEHALQEWLRAIGTGSSSAVMKLYTDDAVLVPTLSPKIRATPAELRDYFDHFTALPGLKGRIDESHLQIFGRTAVNSGLYTFTYTKDGAAVEVPARFTFVYRRTPRGWLIVAHHSSRMPGEG